jgi:hypothetical protein
MKRLTKKTVPAPRYGKLAYALRDNGMWVDDDDFQLLDAVRDLCDFVYKQSEQRVDAVIAELDRAMAR